MVNDKKLLQIKEVSKSFPGVLALNKVSFDVNEGEILALLGENGAGKSTIIKVISGVYTPDNGEVFFDGQLFSEHSIAYSKDAGIETIYQEPSLVGDLTVAENLFLDDIPLNKYRFVDYKALFLRAEKVLDDMNLNINPRTRVHDLSLANIQLVTILKCVIKNCRLIIMDEPSSSLSYEELKVLFEMIKALQAKKIAIIYITHNISDAFAVANRATVLRDGEVMDTVYMDQTNEEEIVSLMIGKQLSKQMYQGHTDRQIAEERVLEVKNLQSAKYKLSDISFYLRKGEILGFYGQVGAGRTELFELVFGVHKPDDSEIIVRGKQEVIDSPSKARALKIGLVPEDRMKFGLFGNMTVRENITIAILDFLMKFCFLDLKKEKQKALETIERLTIKTPGPEQKIMFLSGGNKQKSLIGRWLLRDLDILIMDEPTRGIDVGAKSEIYKILHQLSENGMSVVFISSDIEEIIEMSDRVHILYKGAISKAFEKDEIEKDTLIRAALGVK